MRQPQFLDPAMIPGIGERYVQHPGPYVIGFESLDALFPGILDDPVDLRRFPDTEYGDMNGSETFALAHIVRWLQPQTLVEYGTLYGRSTKIMSDCSPDDARVLTVDLHDVDRATRQSRYSTDDAFCRATKFPVGFHYRDTPDPDKITSVRGDATSDRFVRTLDDWLDHGSIDFALIDAAHDPHTTKVLFDQAFRRLTPGGVILTDDYGSKVRTHVGVTQYFANRATEDGMAFYWFNPLPFPPTPFSPEMGKREDWKDPSALIYVHHREARGTFHPDSP